MIKPTITIQNGHRNTTTGQTGTAGEVELIDKVFYALSPKLIEKGVVVYYDDATIKNGKNTDYFIALHFDGATNPAYNGGFVDCNPDSITVDKDWKFAQTIAYYYFSAMGIRFAPEHRTANSTYYYGFNFTGENTIQTIIELGTLTNKDDNAKLGDVNKIATLLCEGIVAYLTKYDKNYQDYLAGQGAGQNQTTIDGLRQQLQEANKKIETLTNEKKQLAKEKEECQKTSDTLLERLNRIKVYVKDA